MAHTKYVCNEEFGKGPEKFHLGSCPQVEDLERYLPRGGVVSNRSPKEERMRPNLQYSDYREALVLQGFTPCDVCNP